MPHPARTGRPQTSALPRIHRRMRAVLLPCASRRIRRPRRGLRRPRWCRRPGSRGPPPPAPGHMSNLEDLMSLIRSSCRSLRQPRRRSSRPAAAATSGRRRAWRCSRSRSPRARARRSARSAAGAATAGSPCMGEAGAVARGGGLGRPPSRSARQAERARGPGSSRQAEEDIGTYRSTQKLVSLM